MRLLHAETLEFHEFQGTQIPPYAILSHRWENEEVTYQDMRSGWLGVSEREGFSKIQQCCRQAREHWLSFVWVDTCCIDKTSSAELTEAINSMWLWYKQSRVCYAYLSDVSFEGLENEKNEHTKERQITGLSAFRAAKFLGSKWWTRGWTLQELIAPEIVQFFANDKSQGWAYIGDKSSLLELIEPRTNIHRGILRGMDIRKCSIANRMSWVAERETTRVEDMAYCLLGIFGVNMPLLYGEGERAFLRLQEEIMKQSDDQTLFAWELEHDSIIDGFCGPLATSPVQFRGCSGLFPVPDSETPTPYSMTNKGLRIELPILRTNDKGHALAILQCSAASIYPMKVAVPLIRSTQRSAKQSSNHYARDHKHIGPLEPYVLDTLTTAQSEIIYMRQERERNVEMYAEHLVHVKMGLSKEFGRVYFDPIPFIALGQDRIGNETYLLPSDCSRGAIIFVTSDYDLVILFNFELQHIGRMSCKVLCAVPSDKGSRDIDFVLTDLSEAMDHPPAPSAAFSYASLINVGTSFDEWPRRFSFDESPQRYTDTHRSIDDLHREFTIDSNSRASFSYLKGEGAAYASIDMVQSVDRQSTLALSIEIGSRLDMQWPIHELEGDNTRSPQETDETMIFPEVNLESEGAESHTSDTGPSLTKRFAKLLGVSG